MSSDIETIFGQILRSRRVSLGMTQSALADRVKLTVSYVSLLERGARSPRLAQVGAFAKALGVAPYELLGGPSRPASA